MPVELKADTVLDLKGLPCPIPVVRISHHIMTVGMFSTLQSDPWWVPGNFPAGQRGLSQGRTGMRKRT